MPRAYDLQFLQYRRRPIGRLADPGDHSKRNQSISMWPAGVGEGWGGAATGPLQKRPTLAPIQVSLMAVMEWPRVMKALLSVEYWSMQ